MSIKVSVVMAAFNAEQTIGQSVDSALAQKGQGYEVVVVNDGSSDGTAAILAKYGSRIRVITQANHGLGAARNTGVCHSRGRHLAFLDSDDLWLPGKLEAAVEALERNPKASLAFSEYRNIDRDGRDCGGSAIGHAPSIEELMNGWLPAILPSTWVVRRDIFTQTGGFCESFKGAGGFDDTWMLLLLRELGHFVYLSQELTLYRVGDSSKSSDKYGCGLRVFVSLVKERYGSRSNALIRGAKTLLCRWMLSKVAHQMNHQDRVGALKTLAGIARLRPAYFISSEFAERLFLPQNMKRIRDLTSVLNPWQS